MNNCRNLSQHALELRGLKDLFMAWLVFPLLGTCHALASSRILLLIGSCLRPVVGVYAGWAFPFLLALM